MKAEGTINIIANKSYEVDFNKVKTLEDVVVVLKALQPVITFYQDVVTEPFKEICDKGFLKEKL